MSNKQGKQLNKKQKAYAQKLEQQGTNVVAWIIGVLIVCAVLYAFISVLMFE